MKQVVLTAALTAAPVANDFELIDVATPTCPDGGVLVSVRHLSLDPYVGARLRGRHMGEAPPEPGMELIPGAAIVEVVQSKSDMWHVGDLAHTMEAGWAEMLALPNAAMRWIDTDGLHPRTHLSALGMPGLTAWAGMTQLAKTGPGDVVLVDAAAGAVGGMVGQIARMRGGKAIGIAGGDQKCGIVRDQYRFDACIDYRQTDWRNTLDNILPAPPTIIFENVSTDILVAGLSRAAPYAHVVLCGLAGHYHADAPPATLPVGLIIGKRASVHGLVVYDFYDRWEAFTAEVAPWVRNGDVMVVEDVGVGLANAPALMEKLMTGANVGKCIVDV
jgi:NADPH-dependent curcumin reductase